MHVTGAETGDWLGRQPEAGLLKQGTQYFEPGIGSLEAGDWCLRPKSTQFLRKQVYWPPDGQRGQFVTAGWIPVIIGFHLDFNGRENHRVTSVQVMIDDSNILTYATLL